MADMRSWRDIQSDQPQTEPEKHSADGYILRIGKDARDLDELVAREGLVLGDLSDETALEHVKRAERRIAEIRATLQGLVTDKGGR